MPCVGLIRSSTFPPHTLTHTDSLSCCLLIVQDHNLWPLCVFVFSLNGSAFCFLCFCMFSHSYAPRFVTGVFTFPAMLHILTPITTSSVFRETGSHFFLAPSGRLLFPSFHISFFPPPQQQSFVSLNKYKNAITEEYFVYYRSIDVVFFFVVCRCCFVFVFLKWNNRSGMWNAGGGSRAKPLPPTRRRDSIGWSVMSRDCICIRLSPLPASFLCVFPCRPRPSVCN